MAATETVINIEDIIKITPINEEKAEEGTEALYRGIKLKVARSGNDKFAAKFTRLSKPIKSSLEDDSVDSKTLENVMCESLAGTVLVGWSGLVINDQEVKYSDKFAIALLKNDRDCRRFIQKFSDDINNYLNAEEDDIKGK